MPQFMRPLFRATHQASSFRYMTRSPLARSMVRCAGTVSSGRRTTVRRQQAASHDEQCAAAIMRGHAGGLAVRVGM